MPELGKEVTKKINFPEYPVDDPAWVVVVVNPKKEAYLDSSTYVGTDKDAVFYSRIIKDWNFTKDGQKVEITPENVSEALTGADRALIVKELGLMDMISEIKKNS